MDSMPLIGLGTWKLYNTECEKTVALALDLGYRHIDTADCYENHEAIGNAIHSFERKELFITSKIWHTDLDPKKILSLVPAFLKQLKTDYIDLLLIHWPPLNLEDVAPALDAMLTFKETGAVHHIGVSNFVRKHLPVLERYPIFTNQIEMHPYLQRRDLVSAYKKQGISITAYRPLAKGAFTQDPILQKIGAAHGKTASQVALRWLVQQQFTVIPKAGGINHLKENLEIFDFSLTAEEMNLIASLDQGKRYCNSNPDLTFED